MTYCPSACLISVTCSCNFMRARCHHRFAHYFVPYAWNTAWPTTGVLRTSVHAVVLGELKPSHHSEVRLPSTNRRPREQATHSSTGRRAHSILQPQSQSCWLPWIMTSDSNSLNNSYCEKGEGSLHVSKWWGTSLILCQGRATILTAKD